MRGEIGEYVGGELGLLHDLVLCFPGGLKSGRKFKFVKGSKFSSMIPSSISPLVYLFLRHNFFLSFHFRVLKGLGKVYQPLLLLELLLHLLEVQCIPLLFLGCLEPIGTTDYFDIVPRQLELS